MTARCCSCVWLQSAKDVHEVASRPESDEAPPGTDSTSDPAGVALPQPESGIAGTSRAPHAVYWQPTAYHAPPAYASGWYYQDVSKHVQGPFTKQQLQLWRQHLPMDLLVWFIDQNGGSSHSLDLAKVLGDGRLLERWRKAQLATDQPKAAAPSATTYELEVSKASTSSSSWADAALAGLPPDDEAVQMAELAATAGRSIEDVMQFTYGAEASLKRRRMQDGSTEYTVVARHNPLTGRIEAETGNEDAEREAALYRECASWCNPVEYEKYLAQRAKDKGKSQPPKNWKVLKERRLQVKQKLKKQADAWMRE
ncbi:hypothetical protein ABBQ32_000169 [Trebouxia sp. C0010 RCD-2024]